MESKTKTPAHRTYNMVNEKWKTMRPNGDRFCGVHANVMRRAQISGARGGDYFVKALLNYDAEYGVPFTQKNAKRYKRPGSSSFNIEYRDASINLNVDVGDDEKDEMQAVGSFDKYNLKALEQEEAARNGTLKPDVSISSKGHLSLEECIQRTCNDADAETIVKYVEVNVVGDCIIPEAPIGVIETKKCGPTQQHRVESNKVTEPSEFAKHSLNSKHKIGAKLTELKLVDYVLISKYGNVPVTAEMLDDLYNFAMIKKAEKVEFEKATEKIYKKLMVIDDMIKYGKYDKGKREVKGDLAWANQAKQAGDDVDLVDADDAKEAKKTEEAESKVNKGFSSDEDVICFNDDKYLLTDAEIRMFKETPTTSRGPRRQLASFSTRSRAPIASTSSAQAAFTRSRGPRCVLALFAPNAPLPFPPQKRKSKP
ncbi:hypothetical protein Tco_0497918 [Tanacetum coccineum]